MNANRRDFLKASLGTSALVSLGAAAPAFLLRAAAAAADDRNDRVLVVVQLAGGNDGLNTVVPYSDDEYGRNRTTLRLPAEKLHKIDKQLGFHPEMSGFARLLKDGLLGIVQGVGYPNPNQSHPEAMLIWQTANLTPPHGPSGWIGRVAEQLSRPDEADVPAVYLGPIAKPFALHAERAIVPAVHAAEDYRLRDLPGGGASQPELLAASARPPRPKTENPLLDFVARGTLAACESSRRVEAALHTAPASAAEYPPFQLAAQLRSIAQLIRADLGVRVFYTELGGQEPGGFDNHAAQRDNHAALLKQLSDSTAAFLADLRRDRQSERVLLMTFSEFGRTVQENGRRGTDHGAAAPMFLAGGKVRGGLIGAHPSLSDLEKGGLKHHTDFRRVYATLLDRWLGVESRAVLGAKFDPVDCLTV